ncbi:MAG: SGNH/GDSL hydrolase family protein [Clostridia bacterium]|nr:SGNH/GDSL hydrolase family protein [Clostridia bacterium]
MKTRLFALILLIALLFCGCAQKIDLYADETEAATETVTATAPPQAPKPSVQTPAETSPEPATQEVPIALRLTEEEKAARNARLAEVLKGKRVSFIGDSISTFEGYSNGIEYNATIGDNAVYYKNNKNGFSDVNETWWMQTVSATGMELLVNNSWSGDRVTSRGIARAKQLHNNDGVKPDVIVVYLGINDFRRGVTEADFKSAYDKMISGMKAEYPEADVYLCTLVYTSSLADKTVRPKDVEKHNAAIAEIAEKHRASVVDLYNGTGITYKNVASHMCDGVLHPNYKGMDQITECVLYALAETYLK